MLIMSNIGDQVWLMTSRHTDPDLYAQSVPALLESLFQSNYPPLVNVWMEDLVDEANGRRFVWILIG